MKKVSLKDFSFIPASHEDPEDAGALKKVLFTKKDFSSQGRIQMINWAKVGKGKSFTPHFHEDMDEIFIIISGKALVGIGKEEEILEKGDAVFVPMRSIHQMDNIGNNDVDYIAIGISLDKGGKTVIVNR